MTLAAAFLGYAGFVALAAAMQRHRRPVFAAADGPPAPLLRKGGAAFLALAFAACVAGAGWKLGPVLWAGLLTLTAMAASLTLTYRPAWTWRAGLVAAGLGLVGFAGLAGGG